MAIPSITAVARKRAGGVPTVQIYTGGAATPAGWTAVGGDLSYAGNDVFAEITISSIETTHDSDLDGVFDLSGMVALASFDCSDNLLDGAISVATVVSPNLKTLICHTNAFDSIDLSSSALVTLNCHTNDLSGVTNLSAGMSDMETLIIHTNTITSLSLSGGGNLETLDCHNCSLTTIDTTNCDALVDFDMRANVTFVGGWSLATSSTGTLETINISDCSFSSTINVNGFTVLEEINFANSASASVDLSCASCVALINVNGSGGAMVESTIDSILSTLDGLGASNGTLLLNGGTNDPPSATGLLNKASLELRGWTVTTN